MRRSIVLIRLPEGLALFDGHFIDMPLGDSDFGCLWHQAATRAVEKKLPGFRVRKDFFLVPLLGFSMHKLSDGSVVQAFLAIFRTDPTAALSNAGAIVADWSTICDRQLDNDFTKEIGLALPKGVEKLALSWRGDDDQPL